MNISNLTCAVSENILKINSVLWIIVVQQAQHHLSPDFRSLSSFLHDFVQLQVTSASIDCYLWF